ncbi:putative ABC transport system permease protein [Burkholderia multivorans]
MLTLLIAMRNLLRNRRRSLTTLSAMIIGAQAVLIFGGFVSNIARGLETGYVQHSGHFQIQRKGYFRYGAGDPTAYSIRDYQSVIERLRRDPALGPLLREVTPTLSVSGIAGNFEAGTSKPVAVWGGVVKDLDVMRQWDDYEFHIVDRPLALLGTADDAATVGEGVASMLQLCAQLKVRGCEGSPARADTQGAALPDDVAALADQEMKGKRRGAAGSAGAMIELLAATAGGAPNVAKLHVMKAERQGTKDADDVALSMHLAAAQRLVFGNEPPGVTAILVQLRHSAGMPAARARLEALVSGNQNAEPLEVLDFGTLNPFYGQTIAMFNSILGFIAAMIAVIVMFTVSNTMNMAIMERTVEIGTVRALGLRRAATLRLFLCEGALLGVTGASLGVLCAFALSYAINHSGIGWLPPGGTVQIPISVRVWGQYEMIATTFVGLVAVAAVSAWWPARSAARMPIVDALRHA